MKTIAIFLIFISFQFVSNAQYGGGTGTAQDPFRISTTEHLKTLSESPSNWNDSHFALMNNIDMQGIEFTPIGNTNEIFTGSFNGNNHQIKNLTITGLEKTTGTGLFGSINGTITKLGIVNVAVNNVNGFSRVGALAGVLDGGSITYCYTLGGTIDVGNGGWTGSIVGALFEGVTKTVQDCYSTTNISGSWGIGGIVGVTRGEHQINRVAFYGSINMEEAIVTIQNDTSDSQKNGIPPTNAYYAKFVGAEDVNATALSNSELINESKYKTFDFENTWTLNTALGYAILKNQITEPELPYFEKIKEVGIESDSTVIWKQFGPGMAGYNEEFWCHPTDTNVMFMGPDMHISYGTWDNGQNWYPLKNYDGNGLDMQRVLDIQFSLQDPNYGLAIEREGGLLESTDCGKSWKLIKDLGKAHTRITIHPKNDNIWYIGAGDFWNVKANHRTKAKPYGIKQNRADYGYIWKTDDKGKTWHKIAQSISNDLDVGRIVINPNHPDSIIMAAGQGMYISGDSGITWQESSLGLPNNLPRDLTSYYNESTKEFILYTVEQTVYQPYGSSIKSVGGIFKSIDGGKTWNNISGNISFNLQTITNYWARDRYHNSVAYWLGISKAVAKTQYPNYPSSVLSVYNRIVVNPLNKDEIYIAHNKKHDKGFGPGEVYKTTNGGKSWIVCARDGQYWIDNENANYWQSRNSPLGTNIEFAHEQDEMDRGTESSGCRHLQINSKGQLWIGVSQQTLRSDNGGDNWVQVDDFETEKGSKKWISRGTSNLPGRYLLLETGITDRYLLCSGEHGLWQTADLGNWSNKDDVAVEQIEGQVHENGAHSVSTVAVHPHDPNTIYILSWRQEHRGKLRRTTNGGKTWENIATIFDAANNSWEAVAPQYSLMIDPVNPENMYFCTIYKAISEVGGGTGPSLTLGDYGVYRSFDGGYNWSISKADFPAKSSIRRIAMHPDNPEIFYAAMNQFGTNDPGGLYKSTNKTVNWSKVSIPSEIKSVNNVFIDRNTKYIYISCGSRSGAYNAGGVWRSTDDGKTWNQIFKAPYVWQCETSPVNANIILVTVPTQIPNMVNEFKNPGLFLSQNNGESWTKINKNLGHPDKMVDAKPDPYNENILWSAGWGSGWYKAIINPNTIKAVGLNITVEEKEEATLYGVASMGTQLQYQWIAPSGISLTSKNGIKTKFIAPNVEQDTTFTFILTVSNSIGSDTTEVKVKVTNRNGTSSEKINDKVSFKFYPNPVESVIYFSNTFENMKISIFNHSGAQILTSNCRNQINVAKLKSGIYYLTAINEKTNYTQKFLKQ